MADVIEYAVIFVVIGVPMLLFGMWISNTLEDRFRGRF